MNRYEKYKDSGIPWTPEIPVSWDIRYGKWVLNLMQRAVKDDDEVVTCFRDGEVILRTLRRTDGFTMSDKEIGYQGVNIGDIVIHGMDGFAGAIGISKSQGKSTPVYVVCTTKNNHNERYIIYYLRSLAHNDVFLSLSTGIRERSCDLKWNKISVLPFILPDHSEQRAIADFLDVKCAEVDELIALQEKMIDELKVYKQSVITEAVTKGLNPDAPLKDSGIEWIGQIPEHWVLCKLKNLFKTISGATPKTDYTPFWDGDIIWVTPADYKTEDRTISTGRRNITKEGVNSCGTTIVPAGSIIFSKRAPIGLVAINKVPLCTNQGCISCIPNKKSLAQFYYFLISVLKEQFELLGSGTTFKEISASSFESFNLIAPPIEEQQQIADYLDTKCSEIDEMTSIKQQKIEQLKEYKKSIIYEYVTGKKQVIF